MWYKRPGRQSPSEEQLEEFYADDSFKQTDGGRFESPYNIHKYTDGKFVVETFSHERVWDDVYAIVTQLHNW